MNTPKLSIIIPVYNSEKYLKRCLDSIKSQTITDWECIIVNDGSTDNSLSICKLYESLDNRFKVINKENTGVADTRNKALDIVRGEWIGFVDSDDWIEPNRFKKAIEAGEKENIDFVECSFTIWENNKITGHWNYPVGKFSIEDNLQLSSIKYDFGHSVNKVYKSYIFRDWNLRFAGCEAFEDLLMNVELYTRYGKMLTIDDASYNYRRDNNLSLSKKYISNTTRLHIINEYDNLIKRLSLYENFKFIKNNFAIFFDNCLRRHSDPNTVDFVFPYVDNSDPIWQEQYAKYKKLVLNEEVNSAFRFNGDEYGFLRYIFRGIETNMPWIGIIHFIVQSESQIPKWLDTSKVHITYHDTYIPNEYLPTYNSSTIMLYIPYIVGLSENYINSNDDCYVISQTEKSDFFANRNNTIIPKLKYNIGSYNSNKSRIGSVWYETFNNSLLLARKAAKNRRVLCANTQWVSPPHTMLGYKKSLCIEAFKKEQQDLKDSISIFRDKKNISEYYYFWYAILSNRYSNGVHKFVYRLSNTLTSVTFKELINAGYKTICINDTDNSHNDMTKLQDIFDLIYPKKSRYEL